LSLDYTEREIYARQIMMKEIGEAGQQKLHNASVLVVGCGGLGAAALHYLAAMGIGRLGLCDGDVVSLSNLNRQILYTIDDVGKSKASIAKKRLMTQNPYIKITAYDRYMDEGLAGSLMPEYDITVDCMDNFNSRFILNDACVLAEKPFVHAGVGEYFGQLMTVTPGTGPCLRCLFPNEKQKEEPNKPSGIVGATAGIIGALQALEVLKYLIGLPVSNDGMVVYDGLQMSLEKVPLEASSGCICRK
jgi:adenylyltransferase/sulfurtransferase